MSVLQNINGSLYRMDASDLVQLAAVDTEGILGGTPGATTNGQTLVDQLAADDVQAQTDIGQIKTDLSDYHVVPSKNLFSETKTGVFLWGSVQDGYNVGTATNGFVAIGEVETGEQYVVKKNNVGNRFRLVLFKNYPTSNPDFNTSLVYDSNGATDYTFTVPSGGYKYLVAGFNNTDAYSGDIQPMLCTAADYAADPSYEPYWACMRDGMFPRSEQSVLGAKNFLKIDENTQTINGVTFTVNRDSNGNVLNVTVNGTATAVTVLVMSTYTYAQGEYILSGCPSGGNSGTSYAQQIRDTNNNTIINDEGNGKSGTLLGGVSYRAVIRIGNGYTANNLVFYPMLRLASDPDDTYVPYAMTNRELTEKKEYNVTFTTSEVNVQTLVPFKAIRKGYIVNLQGYIKFTATFNAGSNIDGSFSNIPLPLFPCTSATFSGTSVFGANLSTDKTMRLRLPVQQVNGNSVFLNFTYFTEDLL